MYTEFYRLRGEPFLLTPDQRFYFESSVHAQAMAYLTYGISRGEGFIVITGEVGAGKTTLVKRLCASINTNRIMTSHVVTTKLDGVDLLRMVASAFGLKDLPPDKSSLLIRLEKFFESAVAHNARGLLIVDEAQNLTASGLEELRMLSNFQFKNIAPFQIFLIGQPQFRTVLANPDLEQLRQRVIATYHLGPMNRDECGEYLTHRLKKVEWKSDPSFDANAIDAIYSHTGGIPRRINTLCNRLFLFGYLEGLHHFSGSEVNKVGADLDLENSNDRQNGVLQLTENMATSESSLNLQERLGRLEQRFTQQEVTLMKAVLVLGDFLTNRPSSSE